VRIPKGKPGQRYTIRTTFDLGGYQDKLVDETVYTIPRAGE